ncbi:MAG TPA: acetyl-CoA C-acetyltransferase [Elusimicrobia bacterium]|nr:MAG: acetyl-CoA acetyltransferase [Elusimicrobia bacterium GWA2_66_18]OGR68949.1 MAG: acetyl-CoA acetyltransferase [Elusimicrobia bacterium GWC2_65_9]HAZ07581.1 acetyl-CoA C-acetyltransferase [Elusimicrobiota bacterium]
MSDILILSGSRTPIGSISGALANYTAPQLAAKASADALAKAGVKGSDLGEVVLGCVLSAGIGQAPARQAAIAAGIPASVGATTVNKVCGSGMKAVMMASQGIALGEGDYALAGGMESMSKAPYLLDKARSGYRYGDAKLLDAVLRDGLMDPYDGIHMGDCGEVCAKEHAITREMQDEWAVKSYQRAIEAQAKGLFKAEITGVDGIDIDEEPGRAKLEKVAKLRPAFQAGGTITAANASKLNDGAAALVLASAKGAAGRKPIARIAGWATHSQEPKWFTTAPAGAIEKLLKKVGWTKESVDLFEVNEAFAVVALVVAKLAGLPHEKINVHGGAVALGHPLGASGARILVTLMSALKVRGGRRGIAGICLGGGEAVAVALELL